MLVDTGTVMNTANLDYHILAMSQYPEMVEKNIYNVVHFLAALGLKNTYKNMDHGMITTVIRYKSP